MQSTSTVQSRNFDLSNMIIKADDIYLPEELESEIFHLVKSKNFEALQAIYNEIKKYEGKIDVTRITDEIYQKACFKYTPEQFDELNKRIRMDHDGLIGYAIYGIGGDSGYEKRPLLHQIALHKNVSLFAHLLDSCQIKNPCDNQNKSLEQLLNELNGGNSLTTFGERRVEIREMLEILKKSLEQNQSCTRSLETKQI